MDELSNRQLQILKTIIDEYIETAEPVGSDTLDKKYNLGVSPATIRNEMVKLTNIGYLKQPHTSSGRIPTPVALKLYVNKLMKAEELSVAEEVTVKQKIWDYRSKMDKVLKEATLALAEQTKTMSLATTDEGELFASGVGHILEMPEFFDIDVTKRLLETLDENDYWWTVVSNLIKRDDTLTVLMAEDLGNKVLDGCGCIFVRFSSPTHAGAIGVIGPTRLNYPKIIPMVRYVGDLINDIALNW